MLSGPQQPFTQLSVRSATTCLASFLCPGPEAYRTLKLPGATLGFAFILAFQTALAQLVRVAAHCQVTPTNQYKLEDCFVYLKHVLRGTRGS